MGALYFSNGFDICLQFFTNILETLIDYSDKLYYDDNYKDMLMKIYHQNKWPSPKYTTIEEIGLSHERKYIMSVLDINNNSIGYGTGGTKKAGEQKAAKMALIILNKLNKDQYTDNDIFYPSK
jgi:dsRNA-specific ribonuclease